MAYRAALISVYLAISLHCQLMDMGLVHHLVLVLIDSLCLPTEGWPGWVYLGDWDVSWCAHKSLGSILWSPSL